MAEPFQLIAMGHAVMDIMRRCDDVFLEKAGLPKGRMTLAQSPEQIEHIMAGLDGGFEVAGGSAANVAVGMASLGGKAAFIGRVADDRYGRMFQHDIRGTGVSFELPAAAVSFSGTSHSLILVTPDGQRTMLTYLGCSAGLSLDMVEEPAIRSCELVYLEGYLFDGPSAKSTAHSVIEIARSSGRRVAFCLPDELCIERHRASFVELIRDRVDVLFANEQEIKSLYQVSSFDGALQCVSRDVETAVLTRSEQGAVVVTCGERLHETTVPVDNVVDATGAGDMFAAGFIFATLQGADPQAACRLGNFAAAEIITLVGARPEVRLQHLARLRGLTDELV